MNVIKEKYICIHNICFLTVFSVRLINCILTHKQIKEEKLMADKKPNYEEILKNFQSKMDACRQGLAADVILLNDEPQQAQMNIEVQNESRCDDKKWDLITLLCHGNAEKMIELADSVVRNRVKVITAIDDWLRRHGTKRGRLFWNSFRIYHGLRCKYDTPNCVTDEFWKYVYQISEFVDVKENARRDFNLMAHKMYDRSSKDCCSQQIYEIICEGICQSLNDSQCFGMFVRLKNEVNPFSCSIPAV